MRAAKAAIVVACLWWGGAVTAHAAGGGKGEAEGRKHARKANHLADINKCKLAIPEYSKALRLLKDPTLLFNRAECYRRTGDRAKAVADYRKFLVELPSAPNRAQVEGQIAALDNRPAPAAGVAAAPAVAKPPVAARGAAPKPASTSTSTPSATPTSGSAPVAAAQARRPVEPVVPERELSAPAPPSAPEPAESAAPMALIDTKASPSQTAEPEPEHGSSHWWIWVLGAVVVVGAGAGTYFALKQGTTDIPPSALGNYKF